MNKSFSNIKNLPLMVIYFWIAATLTSGEPWTFFGLPSARYNPALPHAHSSQHQSSHVHSSHLQSPYVHSSHLQSPYVHSPHVHSRPTQAPHIHHEKLPKPSIQDKFNFVNFFLKIINQKRDLSCRSNPCDEGFMCVNKGLYVNRICTPISTTTTTTPTSTLPPEPTAPPPICYQDPCNLPAPICSDNPDGSSRCGCKSCFVRSDTDVCTDASYDCRNGYLTAYKRKLAFVAAQVITEVNSVCACKAACEENVNCKTASVEPTTTEGIFNCITSTDPIHDLALEPLTGSYTFAKENSFDRYFSKESGTFYNIIETNDKNFGEIKAICDDIPNGQIIILKNEQDVLEYRAFAETVNQFIRNTDGAYSFVVGLEWNAATTSLQWVDGTPFDISAFNGLVTMDTITGTELGYNALYNANTINIQEREKSWPACQIRPFV